MHKMAGAPTSPVRYIDIEYRLSTLLKNIDIDIDMVIFENIDIDINKAILENIDTDKAILKNIDIDIDKAIPNIAKGTTDPRVKFMSQDHSSQFTNLEYITISKSQSSINFKISTKHEHLD